jgi:isoamyl acetate esterase
MDDANSLVRGTTGRPSDHWTGTELIPPWIADVVLRFISVLNFQALCSLANSIRGRSDCTIDQKRFQCGKDHVVFELAFGDGTFWVARFPVKSESGYTIGPDEMNSEIATIKFVRQHSTIPVPEIFDYGLDESNEVGAPFIIFNALPGRELRMLPRVDDNVKVHVYRQVASLMVQLSRLPRWPEIGLLQQSDSDTVPTISKVLLAIPNLPHQPPLSTARSFFEFRARCFLERMLAGANEDNIIVAWLYRKAIPHLLENDFSPQFPLCHADFGNCNILYDDDYNITGVIDWTWTQSGPWEIFASFPHEFQRRFPPGYSLCHESRELFLKVLEEEENKWNSNVPMTRYMSSKAGRISELTQDYQHITENSSLPMENIRELVGLIYHDGCDWETLKGLARAELSLGDASVGQGLIVNHA